jgi:hypothetical protein
MNKKNKKTQKEEPKTPVIDQNELKSELDNYLKNTEIINKLDSFENEKIKAANAEHNSKIDKLKKMKEEGNIEELNKFLLEIVYNTNISLKKM